MNWKDKIKTFTIGALTTLLTSCGFGGENKEKKAISPDQVLNTMAGEISTTRWQNISRGETDPIADTQTIKEFLEKNKIPYEKKDSVLRSVEWVYETESDLHTTRVIGSKLINPIYEKAQKIRKTNIEEHDGVTIRRKEFKEIPQDVTISISEVEALDRKVEHFEKVKKMVEDKKLEQGLHKGDTVKVSKLLPLKDGSIGEFDIREEQAVVQKDGVSPTYKVYDKTKTRYINKIKFDCAYSDKN